MLLIDVARDLFRLFTPSERRGVAWLLPVMIFSALMEVVGIASIMPFLAIVAEPDVALANVALGKLYSFLGFTATTPFLIFLGVGALLMLLASNALAALTLYLLQRFAWLQKHRLEMRLMTRYLASPYSRFLESSSADLGKNIIEEVSEVLNGVLLPVLHAIARLCVAVAILILMLIVDPVLALTVLVAVGGAYLLVFLGVRNRLNRIGTERVEVARKRYTYIGEAFGGVKDVKVSHQESTFIEAFRGVSRRYAMISVARTLINSLPKYALEAIAFGAILLIVLYLLATGQDLNQLLPIVGLYAFSSYRLMPAVQLIFESAAKVRYSRPALQVLERDLGEMTDDSLAFSRPEALGLRSAIEFRQVTFRYPRAERAALSDVSLRIDAGTRVALVGATGSGKTTTVDVLLGLFEPESGAVLIDGEPLIGERVRAWQAGIGYVSQAIFISDSTIAGNVAFGVPADEVDMDAVVRAAKTAQLHEFVQTLPLGYQSPVGERGIKLSGGQRQRIGLARALYHDPDVLVLDEATSALDGVTEELLFSALDEAASGKTVVMIAHRLSTVRSCDQLYLFEQGRIKARGDYETLMQEEPSFQAMAQGPGTRPPGTRARAGLD